MVIQKLKEGYGNFKDRRRMERRKDLRQRILKAREEGEKEGERKGVNKGVNMAVIPIGLASVAMLLWQHMLRSDDVPPPNALSPDLLNPPPATAPADMDEVDSRARDPWFNRRYVEQINNSLILPRSEDSIVHDRTKIKTLFKYLLQPLDGGRYTNIPIPFGAVITQQASYQAIEESVIREAMGNSEADRAELEKYWNGLPPAEREKLSAKILEVRDISREEILKALVTAQAALDAFLEEHREYQVSGQGRGR